MLSSCRIMTVLFVMPSRRCRMLSPAILKLRSVWPSCAWALKRFNIHLYGVQFVLQVDHEPLKYVNSAQLSNRRLMRSAMFLESYNFRVKAVKGSDNVGADYMSRVKVIK